MNLYYFWFWLLGWSGGMLVFLCDSFGWRIFFIALMLVIYFILRLMAIKKI